VNGYLEAVVDVVVLAGAAQFWEASGGIATVVAKPSA